MKRIPVLGTPIYPLWGEGKTGPCVFLSFPDRSRNMHTDRKTSAKAFRYGCSAYLKKMKKKKKKDGAILPSPKMGIGIPKTGIIFITVKSRTLHH